MRTIRCIKGDRTWFLMTDLEPVIEQALLKLQYERTEYGIGHSFASDTLKLDRVYRNFERYAPEMARQAARLTPIPWEQALDAFLAIVADAEIDWWLTGSAALAVRGMAIEPGDFDLVTDDAGAHRLDELLTDYVYEPTSPVTGWICRWWGRAFLHARFEWIGGVVEVDDSDNPSEWGPTAASRLETVLWQGHTIRVTPLDLALRVGQLRGLEDRVALIKAHAPHLA